MIFSPVANFGHHPLLAVTLYNQRHAPVNKKLNFKYQIKASYHWIRKDNRKIPKMKLGFDSASQVFSFIVIWVDCVVVHVVCVV